MAHDDHNSLHDSMHLAECAAQVADAAAYAVEIGDSRTLNVAMAMRRIPNAHMCHLEAALIMFASMLERDGGCTKEWRESIPELVAFIVGTELR